MKGQEEAVYGFHGENIRQFIVFNKFIRFFEAYERGYLLHHIHNMAAVWCGVLRFLRIAVNRGLRFSVRGLQQRCFFPASVRREHRSVSIHLKPHTVPGQATQHRMRLSVNGYMA